MKQKITITVFEKGVDSLGQEGGPPGRAVDFLAWFGTQLALIPQEYVDTAVIEIRAEAYYDSCNTFMSLEYTRPETDADIHARMELEEKRLADTEAKEMAQLKKLLAKYKTKKD